jgi:4-carboxymuconolactone decarboxylase
MSEPRIPPLRPEEWPASVTGTLEALQTPEGQALNIFATFARHPALFKRWLPFGGQLLQGSELPARDREILILRSGWNCRSDYEWGQHARIAAAAGLSGEEIARVAHGPEAAGWDPFDATLLRAADELHVQSRLSDETWAELQDRYDEHQMIEVPMLVGHYHLVAYTLNSLGVQREPGVVALPTADA